ncbi:hypothetical protein [Luteolibacter sp. LG18]|uniref:hypothetical protein n=1 Tax=Luteolibacter sp. LG18 TaxID=2819286 RepID=UPI0030C6DBBF
MKPSSLSAGIGLLLLAIAGIYFLSLSSGHSAGDGGPDFGPLFILGGLGGAALIAFIVALCYRSGD